MLLPFITTPFAECSYRPIRQCFKLFLKHQIESDPSLTSRPNEQQTNVLQESGFKVLTPQFYTEIAVAPSPASYMLAFAQTPVEKRTFHAANTELVQPLSDMFSLSAFDHHQTPLQVHESALSYLRWSLLSLLRNGRAHSLDTFSRSHLQSPLAESYRRAVSTLLLSQYLCFGVVEVLDVVWAALNVWVVWISTGLVLFT